jgi:hypothetical protein
MTQPKQGPNRPPNRREWCRFLVVDNCRPLELRVGDEVLPAKLLDESAGGFGVMVDRLAGLEVGRTAELFTNAGRCIVRVVHVTRIAPPECGSAAGETPGVQYQLGLLRLDDAVSAEQPTVSYWFQRGLPQWYGSHGTATTVGGLLAAAVVVVPLGLMIGLWYSGRSKAGTATESSRSTLSGVLPGTATSMVRSASSSEGGSRESAESGTSASRISGPVQWTDRPYSTPSLEVERLVRRLPGVTALTLPDIATRLRLTEAQQRQIRRVLDSVIQTIRELERELPGQQRQEMSQIRGRLYDEALQKSLKVLTDQQQAEWQKLTGGSSSSQHGE